MSNALSSLIGIKLTGNTKTGQEYSIDEKNLATRIIGTLSIAFGKCEGEQNIEVVETTQAILAEEDATILGLAGIARRCYSALEKIALEDATTIKAFPKMKDGKRVARDWTSVGLLFRSAMKDLKVAGKRVWTDTEVDSAFKAYWKKAEKTARTP